MVRMLSFPLSILLIAASASATPVDDPEQMAARVALESAMKAVEAELFEPGPFQVDWNRGGVDLRKVVEASPGGSSANYLLSVDNEGTRTVTILEAPDNFQLPATWSVVSRAGAQRSSSTDLFVANLDGPFFVVGWEEERRVGDAHCSSARLGGELHRSSEIEADSDWPSYLLPVIFNAAVNRFQDKTVCWRFDPKGNGFSVSYFLEDGRTLPAMNKSAEVVTIVRAGSIVELLAKPAIQD